MGPCSGAGQAGPAPGLPGRGRGQSSATPPLPPAALPPAALPPAALPAALPPAALPPAALPPAALPAAPAEPPAEEPPVAAPDAPPLAAPPAPESELQPLRLTSSAPPTQARASARRTTLTLAPHLAAHALPRQHDVVVQADLLFRHRDAALLLRVQCSAFIVGVQRDRLQPDIR